MSLRVLCAAVSGHDMTLSLIVKGTWVLLSHPGQRRARTGSKHVTAGARHALLPRCVPDPTRRHTGSEEIVHLPSQMTLAADLASLPPVPSLLSNSARMLPVRLGRE